MRPSTLLAALGVAALPWVPGTPASAEDRTVQATAQNTFSPANVTVSTGDTVTWVYGGGIGHTVTSSSGNWSKDENVLPNDPVTSTFTKAGTYTYYCKTHGTANSGMRGTVVVQAPPSPKPTTSSPRPTTSSPRPTTSSPRPSATSGEPSPDPTTEPPSSSPSPAASASPTARPSSSKPAPSFPPIPTSFETTDTIGIGSGGLGRPDPTGRERGLPIALAIVALGGVVSAQLRTLLTVDRD